MRIHLINLDRSPDRLVNFRALNRHLRDVVRATAVDGRQVERQDLVRRGLIETDLDYTPGALGCSLSHMALWQQTIESGEPLTLCEDDAIFNQDFEERAASLIATLPDDWHFVLWGWNFDSPILCEFLPGALSFHVDFKQDQMHHTILQFQQAKVTPTPFRLIAAFGTPCYTLSPAGARLLQQLCIPIRAAPVFVPALQRLYPNKDLSYALIAAYWQMRAFASFPPLVVTENDHATSTVLTHRNRI